jgi:hypothetical protein
MISQINKMLRYRWAWFLILIFPGLPIEISAQFTSQILYYENNRLTYVSDEEHNRIPDFSHAGYRGGGVPLPDLPVKITLSPVSGDNSNQIQQAINEVGNLPPDENGFRGAVLLNPGIYQINRPLNIHSSGVVLRGSGSGSDFNQNTILRVAPSVRETALQIGSETMSWVRAVEETQTNITTHFVPVGSRFFEVEDASVFQPGDHIVIRHPSTPEWIDAVDGGGTEGDPHWLPGFHDIFYYRTITGINENIIAVDTPVFNHLDRTLSQSFIYKPERSHLVTEVGVENLRIVIQTAGPESEAHTRNGIFFRGVKNGWADNVDVLHFSDTGIGTHTSSHITISNSKALEPHSRVTGGRRYNFNAHLFSNNILFTGVTASDGRRSFIANGTSSSSGIVFHKGRSVRALGSSEGHQKWSQGLLFDNIVHEDPLHYNVLSLHNRGNLGSSHGWAAAHSVAWNVDAGGEYIFIQKPPTAQNYGIGNQGRISGHGLFRHPEGYIEGNNLTPNPLSLYEAQLEERLRFGTPPDVPVDIIISTDTPNEITLIWNHLSLTGDEVVLERSDDGGQTFTAIGTFSGQKSYTDTDIAEQKYHYRLRATNGHLTSAYTGIYSVTPVFTTEIFTDFHLTYPDTGTGFTVLDNPHAVIIFSWDEIESERNLDLTYTWFFDVAGGDFSDPIIKIDSLNSASAELEFNNIGKIMRRSGIDVGERLEGEWKVRATSKTLEKWSSGRKAVSFLKGAKFLPEELSEELFDIELEQNFPNPFNPATTIRYHLGEPGHVRFEVFDLRGTRVAEIDKGEKPRGTHRIEFNAANLASGIYIYRISTGRAVEIRKMMLVK